MTTFPNFSPNWKAPSNISALTTYRYPGSSLAPYDFNNLGIHVGDNPSNVHTNRLALLQTLKLPNEPEWLEQTHSTDCVVVEKETNRQADAAITRSPSHVLAIMTADCLPILICNKQGTEIAGIHAGWKGLVNGIIENTLQKMEHPPTELIAWIGPAICQHCYEVGDDVRDIYLSNYPFAADYFQKHGKKWLINLPDLAKKILDQEKIGAIYQSEACTFENKNHFYSYRRDGQTGRMASLIWFNQLTQD